MSDPVAEVRARVDFVLVNVPPFDAAAGDRPLPALDVRLAELSVAFTLAAFGLDLREIRFAESYDAALAQGTRNFCLIQKIGHLFHGPQAAAALRDALPACEVLMGHIMERGGYYYMHDQCVLVNRRAWEAIGRPPYGTPATGARNVAVPLRSADNVHDDYTPLSLAPTGTTRRFDGAFGYGWQAISESLARGRRVVNWDARVRGCKQYCYAYYGEPREWRDALADVAAPHTTADAGLQAARDVLRKAAERHPFNVLATEPIDIPMVRVRRGLDCVIAPAGTLLGHHLLAQIGFNDATRVVLFGTPAELMLDAALRTRWDGQDLGGFLAALAPELAQAHPEFRLAAATPAAFARELAVSFESPAAWLAHRDRVAKLPHIPVPREILGACDGAAAMIAAHAGGATALGLGGLFNSLPAVARLDGDQRRLRYERLIAAVKAASALHVVAAAPPIVRVRGLS